MRYRILIDLQGTQNNSRNRGIGRYSLALAKGIARNAGHHRVFILLNGLFANTIDEVISSFSGILPRERFLIFRAPGPVSALRAENDWRRRTAELIRERVIDLLAPDVVLITSMFEGGEDDTIVSVGRLTSSVATCAIIYDLIPFFDPAGYLGSEPIKRWYDGKMDSLRRADYLFAISQSTMSDAIASGIEAHRIRNISSAADPTFASSNISMSHAKTLAKSLGIVKRYLMHSSAFDARKNFQGLIRAFGRLPTKVRDQYQLVLVCKLSDAGRRELRSVIADAHLSDTDVVLTGFLSDSDLIAIYVGCHLFVFPSFSEGFGLPALEAMSCGVPTIGSNVASVPEVIGRADALFDPASLDEMSKLILKALTDLSFYDALKAHAKVQASKFSWDDTAKKAIAGIEKLMAERSLAPLKSELPANKTKSFLDAIATIAADYSPDEAELIELAQAMEANEIAVEDLKGHADFCGELEWRIEGPFDSNYSLALVNRETARALSKLGHKVALKSMEGPGDFEPNSSFLDANADLKFMHGRIGDVPHSLASAVSRNLFPPRVNDMTARLNMLHQYAWEESGFPNAWVRDFNTHLHGIACTSTHVAKVLMDNGVRVPVIVSGNGVDHWERLVADPSYFVKGRSFRFLHVSSCFPRKGVDALLDAYGKAFTSRDDVSLIIKTFANPHNEVHALLAERRRNSANYPDVSIIEGDITDAQLKSLFQHCHALVAPSRAEGFGLPLAEAMLSGLAVITTAWSGQLDFCNEGTAWLVDYSFRRASTHFSLPDSVWAEPDVDHLSLTLIEVFCSSPFIREVRARAGRELLLSNYSWRSVAARLVSFAIALHGEAIKSELPRIGWITTWNAKCGVAAYSAHLIAEFPHAVTVFAAHDANAIRDDGANCIRSWRADKEDSGLDELSARISQFGMTTLVLQFNYGFYNFRQFTGFVDQQLDAGRIVIVMMHSTGDPGLLPVWNWTLAEIVPVLARCQRVLVHSTRDLNRLKEFGLIDNVALFPHGVLDARFESRRSKSRIDPIPLIAAYGFCLPHKGLIELVAAAAILRDRGFPVRLRLVNAEYPAPESAQLVARLRELVYALKLEVLVELRHDFLEDAQSVGLLVEADLIIFPYQHTNESASGAVRIGLSAARPVAVTPLDVFDDLGDAVYRLPGTDPMDLANGICSILREVESRSQHAQTIESNADNWRKSHSYKNLAPRLFDLCASLSRLASPFERIYYGSSDQILTEVGHIAGRSLKSSGATGLLMFGPYLHLSAGTYRVIVSGRCVLPLGSWATFDVSISRAAIVLDSRNLTELTGGTLADSTIHLTQHCRDLEIRISVDKTATVVIDRVEISSVVEARPELEPNAPPRFTSHRQAVLP